MASRGGIDRHKIDVLNEMERPKNRKGNGKLFRFC